MNILANLPNLITHTQQVVEKVDPPGCLVRVIAPTGAGRASLANEILAQLGGRGVQLELPPLDDAIDVGTHLLLQLAALQGDSAIATALDERRSLARRSKALASALGDRVLVVRIPDSWQLKDASEPGPEATKIRARDVFTAWLGATRLILLVTPRADGWTRSLTPQGQQVATVRIPSSRTNPEALTDSAAWQSYAEAASIVVKNVPSVERFTPLEVRLMVGLVALGERAERLRQLGDGFSYQPAVLPRLANMMRHVLRRPEHREIFSAVQRLLAARFPLPRQVALEVSAPPSEHIPLITECIGYGQDTVRVTDIVRSILKVPSTRVRVGEDVHMRLAHHHEHVDGATSPPADARMLSWLEKIHHLAQATEQGKERWTEQAFIARDLVWDRARALSHSKQFEEAAELYRRCIERFGKDDYSLHYFAFNLDWAEKPRQQVELAYREAIELSTQNAWWNTRLVTFLIRRSAYGAADQEWAQAVARMDPEGDRIWESPWLAKNAHRWVVREWLKCAEVQRAQAVFAGIPETVVEQDHTLLGLRDSLNEFVEAAELGESVYPRGTPSSARWKGPRVLAERLDAETTLALWFPCRVVRASDEQIVLVLVSPTDRRVFSRPMTHDEWRTLVPWCSWQEAQGRFMEFGSYSDGRLIVLPVPSPGQGERRDHAVRALRPWRV
jgi:tetratricopeptide (TPR) repeat protein